MNSAALAEVMDSPQLPAFFDQIRDRLRDEAARRQQFVEEVDEGQKAEFINGEVIYHSPARAKHIDVTMLLLGLLVPHVLRGRLGRVFSEKCMVRCQRNDYEPDVVFYGPEKAAEIGREQLLFAPPDLVVEVLSNSTEHRDRGVKFEDYAAHGVREYWIIDTDAQVVEQYTLPPGADIYSLAAKCGTGDRLASTIVPGFDVPVSALFDPEENPPALLALLKV